MYINLVNQPPLIGPLTTSDLRTSLGILILLQAMHSVFGQWSLANWDPLRLVVLSHVPVLCSG